MKVLSEIYEQEVYPDLKCDVDTVLVDSFSARALLFNDDGRVALMRVEKKGIWIFPGGTLDLGENFEEALHREILEEVGCRMRIDGVLGDTIEYRYKKGRRKINRCFFGVVVGEVGEPQFTDDEIAEGASIEWVDPADLFLYVERCTPVGYVAPFAVRRFKVFLDEAQKQGLLND